MFMLKNLTNVDEQLIALCVDHRDDWWKVMNGHWTSARFPPPDTHYRFLFVLIVF